MIRFTPNRDPGDAERRLARLVIPRIDPLPFKSRIEGLRRTHTAYAACCPPPWAGPGLQVTHEISYQSELWLPIDQLRSHFHTLYRQSLAYPPILSSTPFAHANSWATIVADFPEFLGPYPNPAALLEQLVVDDGLRLRFLFWSFMPDRFYGGGSDRYPAQSAAVTEWLRRSGRDGKRLRCLDAACGDGAATYGLARLFIGYGRSPDSFEIEGWTLEPLEAWTAAHGRFPHDPAREALYREETRDCFAQDFAGAVCFRCADILAGLAAEQFDLILCNGLLGGPILHAAEDLDTAVRYLAGLLAPGGLLLAEDRFHGGWKQKCPQQELRALFEKHGLIPAEVCEGIGALAPQAG